MIILKQVLELSRTDLLKFIMLVSAEHNQELRYPDLLEEDPSKRVSQSICRHEFKEEVTKKGYKIKLSDIKQDVIDFAKEKISFINQSIKTGYEDFRKPLEPWRREMFEKDLVKKNLDSYPDSIPEILLEASCKIFGHMCPVFFVVEPFTETKVKRSKNRNIPTHIKLRIARRDNYTCQVCGKHLNDFDIEFDHKIPLSKGGSSEESNIQILCIDCNRAKSAKIPEL